MSDMWSPGSAARARPLRLVQNDNHADVGDPYTTGYAAAVLAMKTELAAERAMLVTLVDAATSIERADPEPLAALLAATVMRLVRDVAGSAPVDEALLKARALVLADAIQGPDGPVTVRVHPDCVALLDGVRNDLSVCGDVSVPPGQIVMVVGGRGAEDGVISALDRVRAALGDLS
ncbi:hypothetical protein [Sphingomonas sp.]|uniref:hypothetical protein n=1 Tax=Sphingomonas sp. TaxID=28214 RepID=UPI0025D53BD5|nr:hypothetical protein [Sphingomonas sp.]